MACWQYQMSAVNIEKGWTHDEYNGEVREGILTTRSAWKVVSGGGKPQKGDMAVLFFAWTGDPEGGICGWAEVQRYDEELGEIDFVPRHPSDSLKKNPILNDTVKDITKKIRRGFFQGNIWEIPPDLLLPIRHIIGV